MIIIITLYNHLVRFFFIYEFKGAAKFVLIFDLLNLSLHLIIE